MNTEQFKRTLKLLPPRISVLVEANHGLGKSDMIRQVAAELSITLKKPFGLIDFRLAQCEVADIIGMMRHVDKGKVTHIVYKNGEKAEESVMVDNITLHDIAEWFPTDPNSSGFLFLDELFRAPRDLQNAVMELALDYRYHFKELPIGWRVIAASNDNMDIYAGTTPDPALYDRFLKIKLKPTIPEWLAYAESIEVHRAIITYINKFGADLMPEKIEPGIIGPSPRSWVFFSKCLKYMAEQNEDPLKDLNYLVLLAKGYLGDTISVNFAEYVRQNYKVYNGEDLVNKFDTEMKKVFGEMVVTEIAFYSGEIIKYVKNLKVLNKKQCNNIYQYLIIIPKEAAGGFWAAFIGECRELATKWYNETPGVKDYIFSFLNKADATK